MGQKDDLNSIVVIGKVGAPFGVKGWAHIHSFALPSTNILNYKIWQLRLKNQWQAMTVLEAKAQGKGFVALLKGYDTRELVAKLTNSDIGIPHSALPPLEPGEYYWADLVGLKVINEDNQILGTIEGLIETGSNDVLVVKGEKKDHLIPYIPDDYVLNVDVETGIMRVSWDPEF